MDDRVREDAETLTGVLAQVWILLARCASDQDNHAVLATVAGDVPDARTVALREVDAAARRLFINTDRRSPKEDELERNPRAVLVVYDEASRTQLRLRLRVRLHYDDAITRAHWQVLPFEVRRLYMTVAPPGDIAGASTAGLASGFAQRAPDPSDDAAGYSHFVVLEATVTHLDWLRFTDAGSRRAAFAWDASGHLRADWLYP